MPYLHAHDAPAFELRGARVTGLASPSRGSSELTTYRVRLDPGSALPQHHHDHEEVFTVVSGSLTAVLDAAEHLAGPGDTVIIPPGTEHHSFTGHEPADMIVATLAGALMITPDGEEALPAWGE